MRDARGRGKTHVHSESAQFTLEAQKAAGKTNPKLLNLIARIKLTWDSPPSNKNAAVQAFDLCIECR